MSNIELLDFIRTIDVIHHMVWSSENRLRKDPNNTELFALAIKTAKQGNERIKIIQSKCSHPIGLKDSSYAVCPICEAYLPVNSFGTILSDVPITDYNIVRERLAEILGTGANLSPEDLASYLESEFKHSRK